ncbi:XRE family transcriptional regulator [Acinetobacter colistiniresistens]|uniref:Helix-turn-helix domain-containing protein n=1 Tax=Acinetobacter colistiniresistens TaxID=280145 RepID=A0A558EWN0_9GAMM|nr:helix-turn-helix domain-containing protein [Acinetobacter colistiniresistens]TVT77642.1 helix-turn-helix domain-containing protein [Acinetobacter colistiniresistens]
METLGIRLKQLRKDQKLTQQQLADKVGVSKTSVIYWEKDENIPKHESLMLLSHALNCSPDWLLNGGDKITSTSSISKDEAYLTSIKFKSSFENKNTVKIPVHKDVKAACGNGVTNFLEEISDYLDIDPAILKLLGIKSKPENLRVIYSAEYSMWPTVSPDSPLFVDISPIDTDAIINGDVYVFLHNGCLRMKRIFVSYGNEKTVRLQSDNPDKNKYPDEIISKEQLNELSFVGRLESALVKP